MYALLFLIGFFGFLGMAGLSFLHSGHDSHTGNHGSTGEAIGSLKAIQHGHARAGHHHGHAKAGHVKSAKSFKPWWAFSPFDIFAYCTGAGAVGEIIRTHISPGVTIFAAVMGALFFNFGLAKPILNTLLRFESRQSEGLEGSVAQEVEAITKFDGNGRGLVRLCLDGQIVQVLGILDPEEIKRGVTVAKGDPLLVLDVDAARNTCRVTRELA